LIKVSSGLLNSEEFSRLKSRAQEAGVMVMDEVLSREKSYGLIEACDCYVSLHRSEGLGLTMAEAMLMAKPVIATAYSGNLDFMNPSNAMLVDYQLRQLRGTCADYVFQVYKEHAYWANPSVDHAAVWMRWAFEHQEEAKVLGIKAREHAEQVLSPKAAGRRLKARLEEIHAGSRSENSPRTSRSAA
jgi:glycosyltransferase involved in cell wall biosynthesis